MFDLDVPTEMSPERLDELLARGWFRSGPVLFRAEMMCLEDDLCGLVHVRIPLEQASGARRSHRRLLRRNRERFRCRVGEARVDAARERLYQATKPRFMGFVAESLHAVLFGDMPRIFDPRELQIFDGDELVAVSYFDVGRTSVASLLGLHDPRYARYSLGFYSMLEEMEFARTRGGRYYYPGYVVPGLPAFDYKLRLGDPQYLEGGRRWRRRARPPVRVQSAARARRRVDALERAITACGVPCERRYYSTFWLGYMKGIETPYIRGIVHIRHRDTGDATDFPLVEYIADEDAFRLGRVRADEAVDTMEQFDEPHALHPSMETRALYDVGRVCESASAREIAHAFAEACEPDAAR